MSIDVEALIALLDNRQMPDDATPRVTLGELRELRARLVPAEDEGRRYDRSWSHYADDCPVPPSAEDEGRLREAAQNLLAAIDAKDEANIHGWSVALREAAKAIDDKWSEPLERGQYVPVYGADLIAVRAALAATTVYREDEGPLRESAAAELLDAVEALLASEPKSYWLRGQLVSRLRSAYNAVVALAATPEPRCRCVTKNGIRQPTFGCPVHSDETPEPR